MIPTKRPMLGIASSRWQILLIFPFPEFKGMLVLRLLRYQCPHGDLGMTRTLLVLEKVFTKIKETFSLKLLVLTYLYLHPTEKHRDPRFLLLLRNASKHHCLRCRRDPHVNVWSYLSLMMKSCEASRTIAFLAPIFFTMWGTMTPEEILAEHVVDFRRIAADFRDAYERSQTSSTRASGVNKFFTSQAPLQRRLSVYNWNPGPDETQWMP